MAFSFSPKHVSELSLDNLSTGHFLVISLETANKLEWNIGSISEHGFLAYTGFSMSSVGEEIKVSITGDKAIMKSECTGNQLVDWGKNKQNLTKFIASFDEIKNAYSAEELDQKYEELKPDLATGDEDILKTSPPTTKERITGLLSIFKPTKGFFITPIVIDLNIAVFILMAATGVNILLPDGESLIRWGANFRTVTLAGEWWRLLTNCFLHIGIFHLLMNMYALLYIGLLLEPHLGKSRFLSAYLLTGLVASVTSLWWHDLSISAGASGAIFGMYGVFLAMLTTNLIEKSARKALLTSIVIFVGYNLVNGMRGGIDNAAHIGGLISGIVIGYSFVPGLKNSDDLRLKYSMIAVLIVIILIGSALVCKNIAPYEIEKYESRMKEFASKELMALEMYSMPDDTPKEDILREINSRSIYYWNESLAVIKEMDLLKIPDVLHERNMRLTEYCELRIKSCELISRAVDEETDKYKGQIEAVDKQIEAIINELSGKQ
jgi:rhomboid protease GluP